VNEDTVVDLKINGVTRKVIVHFNKNGFTYILDRKTGELISANPFAFANWATGVDLKTACPRSITRWTRTPASSPTASARRRWREGLGVSSYSPSTKLFYFGGHNLCMNYDRSRSALSPARRSPAFPWALYPVPAATWANSWPMIRSRGSAPGPSRSRWPCSGHDVHRRRRRLLRHAGQAVQSGRR